MDFFSTTKKIVNIFQVKSITRVTQSQISLELIFPIFGKQAKAWLVYKIFFHIIDICIRKIR